MNKIQKVYEMFSAIEKERTLQTRPEKDTIQRRRLTEILYQFDVKPTFEDEGCVWYAGDVYYRGIGYYNERFWIYMSKSEVGGIFKPIQEKEPSFLQQADINQLKRLYKIVD